MTTISIIVPVYNAEKYLRECIESLLSQTFNDIEILCINDGSKDDSLTILNEYANKDKRIKVFNQENSGPAKARNVGLENAHGKFLMFCDSDDTYEPTMCEDMLTAINKYNVDFVMCDVNTIETDSNHGRNEDAINYQKLIYKGLQTLSPEMKLRINVLLWNKIFKMDIIQKYSIDFPTGHEADDNAFIWQYLSVSKNFYGLDKKLYNYKLLNNSIMGKIYAQKHTDKFNDYIYSLKHFSDFLIKNDLMHNNDFFLECTISGINSMQRFLNISQQKEYIRILKQLILPTITKDNFTNLKTNPNYKQLTQKIKSIQRANKICGKIKLNGKKIYYLLGLPILKKIKTDQIKECYFLGIKIYSYTNSTDKPPYTRKSA